MDLCNIQYELFFSNTIKETPISFFHPQSLKRKSNIEYNRTNSTFFINLIIKI